MAIAQQDLKARLEPGTWTVDPAHTQIEFVARHMMVSKVRGSFGEFTGTVHVAPEVTDSWAEATLTAATITTGVPDRDNHLRSPDFLDAENFPALTFLSTSLEPGKADRYTVTGDLTIKDVTRPVELDVEFAGTTIDLYGNTRAFLAATTEIDRDDFGITWNMALETGGVLVSKKITIEIEAQLVKAQG